MPESTPEASRPNRAERRRARRADREAPDGAKQSAERAEEYAAARAVTKAHADVAALYEAAAAEAERAGNRDAPVTLYEAAADAKGLERYYATYEAVLMNSYGDEQAANGVLAAANAAQMAKVESLRRAVDAREAALAANKPAKYEPEPVIAATAAASELYEAAADAQYEASHALSDDLQGIRLDSAWRLYEAVAQSYAALPELTKIPADHANAAGAYGKAALVAAQCGNYENAARLYAVALTQILAADRANR